MSEATQRSSTGTVLGGLLVLAGGILVAVSIFVPTVTVANQSVDLYLVGGVIFAIGFAAGARLHLDRGDRQRAAAQLLGALGWLLAVVGGTIGPSSLFIVGLGLLLGAGLLLYDVPGRLRRRLAN
ncbi:MAG: hypothetical protein ABEJ35_06630 [Halobacteriaceae archaeon]